MATTMMCAEKAGVPIFVTGGLGGVHRGGEYSQPLQFSLATPTICLHSIPAMDVSADVVELGRTPVGVVCAGIKSILDIGRTLEVLVCPNSTSEWNRILTTFLRRLKELPWQHWGNPRISRHFSLDPVATR